MIASDITNFCIIR